jgi:hypothetical protein
MRTNFRGIKDCPIRITDGAGWEIGRRVLSRSPRSESVNVALWMRDNLPARPAGTEVEFRPRRAILTSLT